mmetsp:Transcript_31884/g.48076  ORF Transcript_31884/g.48076 Transcript_31884/m.48076 type:complete len:275 (+) Transcript_31884:65-889(+)|eukprot:scaffold9308_cov133-Skeletonema_dohrnii-CCMP3373.AAC.4
MPPPNNPPPPPSAVNDAALGTKPPPLEESRFEAALCLMNLQRPLENSADPPPPPQQRNQSLSAGNPSPQQRNQAVPANHPPSIAAVSSAQLKTNNNNLTTCPPIQTALTAPFHMGTTHPPPPALAARSPSTPISTNHPLGPKPTKKKRVRLNYICTIPNCTNLVRKSGVCIRHGAQVKLCSFPKCRNHAKNGGVCRRHGASRPCGREGCGNMVVKQGLCIKHWREENSEGGGEWKKGKGTDSDEFLSVVQGEERERELAVAALLAGQRSGGGGI